MKKTDKWTDQTNDALTSDNLGNDREILGQKKDGVQMIFWESVTEPYVDYQGTPSKWALVFRLINHIFATYSLGYG